MNNKKKELKQGLLWLMIPASALLLAFILNTFFIVNAYVPSESMAPTVKKGSLIVGSRLAYREKDAEVGDIIIFRHPEAEKKNLVKRIAALPGDTFSVTDGIAFRNGEKIGEGYPSDFPEITVPDGCVIVLGDNVGSSTDSLVWENPFVKTDDIIAKAVFTYFPSVRSLD